MFAANDKPPTFSSISKSSWSQTDKCAFGHLLVAKNGYNGSIHSIFVTQ
jgi:hypothetical protein